MMATSEMESLLVTENQLLTNKCERYHQEVEALMDEIAELEAMPDCYIAAIEKSEAMEKEIAAFKKNVVEYLQQLVLMFTKGDICKEDFQECTETYFSDLIEEWETQSDERKKVE